MFSGRHPFMIGPVFIHHLKTEKIYLNMAQHLQKNCGPEIRFLKAFGTDDDEALIKAMKQVFPDAIHLMCDLHMKDNVAEELAKCQIPKQLSNAVLFDIFGARDGDERKGTVL